MHAKIDSDNINSTHCWLQTQAVMPAMELFRELFVQKKKTNQTPDAFDVGKNANNEIQVIKFI